VLPIEAMAGPIGLPGGFLASSHRRDARRDLPARRRSARRIGGRGPLAAADRCL